MQPIHAPRPLQSVGRRFASSINRWFLSNLLIAGVSVFSRLSSKTRSRIASFFGHVAVRWIPVRRRVAEENLKIAFPEETPAGRRRILVESYTCLIAGFLDLLAMFRCSEKDILAGVEEPMDGVEKLNELRSSGRGFIIVTAHTGSWEWGGAYLASLGIDLADVAKPLENPVAERFTSTVRNRFRIKLISTRNFGLRAVRHIRGGGVLSLFSDQNVRKGGVFVPFFGRAASTSAGAGHLAYRLGVPVLPMWGCRTSDGKIRGFVDDPIWPDTSKGMDSEIQRITRLHVESLERFVRLHPGQYFWFHRRWKTQPL
ncbi:MAG: hypothetical protein HY286_01420 [Planctomycetes bacterium]|nr:hypothetical protein [Planctomycetota bacterium]